MKRYPKEMVQIHWTMHSCIKRLWERLKFYGYLIKLTFVTLCYNEFADKFYVGDTCMEPMFWFVDHFTKAMGPIFVVGVIILTLSMIIIAYTIGLSFWWQTSIPFTILLLIVGNWLLVNVIFHYYMAFITLPGYPPEGALVPEAVSICKRCISPKPPRTHHCSVCNRCILKMDHHCPWLNNCIGYYNHRYFFMYCVYIWLSVSFVLLFGIPIAYVHFFVEVRTQPLNTTIVIPENKTHQLSTYVKSKSEKSDLETFIKEKYSTSITSTTVNNRSFVDYLYHACLVYAALLCLGVFLAIGALTMWHARLITRGETSVEAHINKKERERLAKEGKTYKNPYNFGPRKNWIIFLGLTNGRDLRHVLFPSRHKPDGDGLRWHTRNEIKIIDDWNVIIDSAKEK
ncbi:palmitoyltransferase ZDHHC16-like [Centruroides sculpturatus]|uniref:palmitoyltransferase ZDHHC16-like n=1 Tax=Centruroides sculpturatus TaxID=218467 RepID=UPI000C6DF5F7|nr:palmitoyltransferase ZDHHC16-like [Centruroides sculpturatus]XP_023233187.1 palmitoyltransferase ZDHHC16-like [Centruroides sculpturatus]XP_023233188.1 palmitoyltransferase ZDHHC16-like [Centruroides sculpturatus]